MNVSIVTLFPELYSPFLATSLVGKAQEHGHANISLINMFSMVEPKERIDSPTFGHGAGMLIKPEIVEKAIEQQEAKHGEAFKIFFSPAGKKLDQNLLKHIYEESSKKKHVMLLPARYEGMDARVEQVYADCLVSIGDFVLMGGDLPAMVLLEGLLRYVPGVIGKQSSVEQDSFSGPFVDNPEYTSPVVWKGLEVPEVIRSGDHKKIQVWQKNQAVEKTIIHHFEWLRSHIESKDDIDISAEYMPHHYAILMHDQVNLPDGTVGTSSVTSIDIHDIARSATTYGIKKYFIVTPLADQQKIIAKLLNFWHTSIGIQYNNNRHEALKNVTLVSTFEDALNCIKNDESASPLVIATAAKRYKHASRITYHDQEKVWSLKRPIALVFGTARGLSSQLLDSCDYLLEPIESFSKFNHLSVRSAAAIVFDRWLGINRVKNIT